MEPKEMSWSEKEDKLNQCRGCNNNRGKNKYWCDECQDKQDRLMGRNKKDLEEKGK